MTIQDGIAVEALIAQYLRNIRNKGECVPMSSTVRSSDTAEVVRLVQKMERKDAEIKALRERIEELEGRR